MIAVIIDPVFSLSETVDCLILLPEKAKLCRIGGRSVPGPQILYEIPVAVYGVLPANDRCLPLGAPDPERFFRQLLVSFPQKKAFLFAFPVNPIPGETAGCFIDRQLDAGRTDLKRVVLRMIAENKPLPGLPVKAERGSVLCRIFFCIDTAKNIRGDAENIKGSFAAV